MKEIARSEPVCPTTVVHWPATATSEHTTPRDLSSTLTNMNKSVKKVQ